MPGVEKLSKRYFFKTSKKKLLDNGTSIYQQGRGYAGDFTIRGKEPVCGFYYAGIEANRDAKKNTQEFVWFHGRFKEGTTIAFTKENFNQFPDGVVLPPMEDTTQQMEADGFKLVKRNNTVPQPDKNGYITFKYYDYDKNGNKSDWSHMFRVHPLRRPKFAPSHDTCVELSMDQNRLT